MTTEEKIQKKAEEYSGFPHGKQTMNINGIDTDVSAYRSVGNEIKRASFIAGASFGRQLGIEEAFEWIDINDRSRTIPNGMINILLKLEDGSVMRYDEDWEGNRLLVTHWRPINLEDFKNLQK